MPAILLPSELVADILDTFILNNPSHAARAPNLASFAAVSRQWYAEATPLLYRNLYLSSRTRSKLAETLRANDSLGPLVRELTLSGGNLDAAEYERLKRALATCTGVTSLSYHCFEPAILEDLTWFVSATWPDLRYLRADQSAHLFDLLARLPALETLIASYIEFPAPGSATPSPASTRAATPAPGSDDGRSSPSPSPPVRPIFRLKRFDSGSSPLPANFHFLTSSSAHTLRSLDLPLSSLTSQDLSPFASLTRLTLTLAERYLPLPAHTLAVAQRAHGTRNDRRLIRRMQRILLRAEAADVPLSTLEVYEPAYAKTGAIARDAIEGEDLLACVPRTVARLELATLEELKAEYVAEVFARGLDEEGGAQCCVGVRQLVLGRRVAAQEGARGMLEVLARRGVEVSWE
ncbi:hypothetical protein JCM10449v2_005499 [Rhodotorula kratochvilovae]